MEEGEIVDLIVPEGEVDTKVSNKRGIYIMIATLSALVLLGLGFIHESHVMKNTATHLRGLLDMTIEGRPMPVPFWIVRQDVDESWKVQDAFANFFYLKGKSATLKNSDGSSVLVNFFDSIKRTNTDGSITTMGYFNPTSPKGQPSNVFNFEYGDKCAASSNPNYDYTEGFLELVCGPELSILSVSETDRPCKYKITATAPQRCAAHELHPYLVATTAEASDSQYWTYKINFFKESNSPSHVFAYHSSPESGHTERVLLGDIEPTLDADKNIRFRNGDLNPITKRRNQGVIHLECGCDYSLQKITEVTPGNYDAVVTHPKACMNTPQKCDKADTEEDASSKKSKLLIATSKKPSYESLGKFPRNLLTPKHK
jgi:hypothetical protein